MPQLKSQNASLEALSDAEIRISVAVLKYARQARGGRISRELLGVYFDQPSNVRDPNRVLQEIAAASRPDAYLRSLHPKHPQFELLRQALLRARGGHADNGGWPPRDTASKSAHSDLDPSEDRDGRGDDYDRGDRRDDDWWDSPND